MTITEAFAQYDVEVLWYQNRAIKTRKNYKSTLTSFVKSCGDIPVELLSYDHCIRWKMDQARLGHSNSTTSHSLNQLRSVIKYLRRRGRSVIDPADIEVPRVRPSNPVWLEVSEIGRILSVIKSARDKAIIACLFSSGARISELLSLNRYSIQTPDGVQGTAEIEGKGGKIGTLQFDANALKYLNDYLETRNDNLSPLFVSAQRRCITVSRVEQLVHQYADEAGIDKNVTPHVFRHSFATNVKLNGGDIYDVKEQLRHSNISTTQIYIHIGEQKKREQHAQFHTPVPLV